MSTIAVTAISTERLTLLPLLPEHADEMTSVLADPALYTFIGGTPPTRQELRSRYTRWSAGSPDPGEVWCNWVIRLRCEESLAGWVQATIRTADVSSAELAWVIGAPWQGRGIATEAARALVAWLREQAVRTIVAHIHPDHMASAAVATAAGLAPTGLVHDGELEWRLTARFGDG